MSIFPIPRTARELATYERTIQRLIWAHGHKRADRIEAGCDPKTTFDLARWRHLGSNTGQAA